MAVGGGGGQTRLGASCRWIVGITVPGLVGCRVEGPGLHPRVGWREWRRWRGWLETHARPLPARVDLSGLTALHSRYAGGQEQSRPAQVSTGQVGHSVSQSVSQSALCFFSPFTRNIHHIFCSPRSFSCITLLFALAIRTDDAFTHHLPLLLLLVLCFSVPPRTELPASRIQDPLSPGDHATPVLALPVSVNLQYEQMHPC